MNLLKMFSSIILTVCIVSALATTCSSSYQGIHFSAAYYTPGGVRIQQSNEVSCDYGKNPDGSYQYYVQQCYPLGMPVTLAGQWYPDPVVKSEDCTPTGKNPNSGNCAFTAQVAPSPNYCV